MKSKRILLTALLVIGFIGATFAGLYDDWPDDSICGWLEQKPTHAGYLDEAKKRGLTCEGGKAVKGSVKTITNNINSTTKSKVSTANSDITIYEVVFSRAVLKELLDRVISKTDFDFSKHKLTNNVKDIQCRFTINRVIYENSELGEPEYWDMAQGTINIKGSDVEFGEGSYWKMGGLSTDKSYLRDEVNIKLTEDGHFVGKMAYFTHTVKQGEVPREPLYPTLTKHKRSKPINLNNINDVASLWIDVEDWAGGIIRISSCKYL